MDEAKIRLEIAHAIFNSGWDWHHPEDHKKTGRGRPDLFGLNSVGPTIVIEVKKMESKERVEPWIPFSIISDAQRRWLDWWYKDRLGAGFLAIGTTFGKPRRLWIIPWHRWVAFEKWKSPNGTDERAELCDLDQYFKKYEMIWKGNGKWEFGDKHPLLFLDVRPHDEGEWEVEFSYRFEEAQNGTGKKS